MKKKLVAMMLLAALAVSGLTGCGASGTDNSSKAAVEVPTEPFGDTIKYDPTVEINGGKGDDAGVWRLSGRPLRHGNFYGNI